MIEWFGGFIKVDGGKSISLQELNLAGGGTIHHNSE
jgi:hypothetical protein